MTTLPISFCILMILASTMSLAAPLKPARFMVSEVTFDIVSPEDQQYMPENRMDSGQYRSSKDVKFSVTVQDRTHYKVAKLKIFKGYNKSGLQGEEAKIEEYEPNHRWMKELMSGVDSSDGTTLDARSTQVEACNSSAPEYYLKTLDSLITDVLVNNFNEYPLALNFDQIKGHSEIIVQNQNSAQDVRFFVSRIAFNSLAEDKKNLLESMEYDGKNIKDKGVEFAITIAKDNGDEVGALFVIGAYNQHRLKQVTSVVSEQNSNPLISLMSDIIGGHELKIFLACPEAKDCFDKWKQDGDLMKYHWVIARLKVISKLIHRVLSNNFSQYPLSIGFSQIKGRSEMIIGDSKWLTSTHSR